MTEYHSSTEAHPSIEKTAEARQDILDRFAEHPQDDSIWQTAYDLVRAEGDHPDQISIGSDIPVDELLVMADTVRRTPSANRYDLMAQRTSVGKYWFDVIEGFSSDQVRGVQADVVGSWFGREDSVIPFYSALDVGTGVGKSLAILESHAYSVVGLDQNPALLEIAKERAGSHTSLVQGTANKMPFDDSSFDLVSSQGLRAALDKDAATGFLKELARVMTPNGVYIEGHYYSPDEAHPHPELARFTETAKAMLTDMIGDTVSGSLDRFDLLTGEEAQAILEAAGLREEHYDVVDEDGVSHTLITLMSKVTQ